MPPIHSKGDANVILEIIVQQKIPAFVRTDRDIYEQYFFPLNFYKKLHFTKQYIVPHRVSIKHVKLWRRFTSVDDSAGPACQDASHAYMTRMLLHLITNTPGAHSEFVILEHYSNFQRTHEILLPHEPTDPF